MLVAPGINVQKKQTKLTAVVQWPVFEPGLLRRESSD